ncbi:MAG: DNA primase [Burkholderiaceae bacterium]
MSLIPESFIQELLARVDVADIVGRYVTLRKGGANLLGLCPFHNEKSPSFTVSPTKQFYHCFGCGAHGTAITFLMEHTGASFPEAVRSLAAGAGLTVPEEIRTPRQRVQDKQRKEEVNQHQQALDTAQAYYLKQLKASPAAVRYLKDRGLTGETAARFGLGWSGNDRRGLATVFPNYNDPLLVESGLVIEAEDGRRYDRFRERIMFPIRNTRGKLIGFGGRIIGKGEPKYLNSPETPLFSKGHELYGLWENRAGIRTEGFVLVVEGYMDVVGLAQHGLANAVATLGTATTPHHIQKLIRAANKIIFSFDGDAAGRRAAWKALVTCLPLVRDDIAMRFLFLPHKHDPDSYIREFGAQAFRATVAEAQPLSRFLLDELASRHAMNEAEGRAACVHEAAPLLAQLPETTLRVQIEREFATRVLLTPEELADRLAQVPAPVPPPSAAYGTPPPRTAYSGQAPQASHPAPSSAPFDPAVSDAPEFYSDPNGYSDPDGVPGWVSADAGPPDWDDWAPPSHPAPPARAATPPFRGAAQPFGGQASSPRRRPATRAPANPRPTRAVTPMAKRLLRLVLGHPALVSGLGDQQLEILHHGPHLVLVRELITLVHTSGAQHTGAILQAAEPGSELQQVLQSLSAELVGQEELPNPGAEWNDALRRIELDAIKAEQSALVAGGLSTDQARQRYHELTRRMALLSRMASPQP